MRERLSKIPEITSFSQALVEAGHFYGEEELGDEHFQGVRIGVEVIEALRELGMEVTPAVLVDDYHSSSFEDYEEKLKPFSEVGFGPEILLYKEKNLISDARQLEGKLTKAGKTSISKNGKVYLKGKGEEKAILLSDRIWPTCSLLDAALYIRKYWGIGGGYCITVLPEKYRSQQETTKKILDAAGEQIPILNVYFDQEGNIFVDFDF